VSANSRAAPHSGILMITVRDFDEDKVRGLEAGADDYVTKPFKLRELTARLRAVLRRTKLQAATEPVVVEIENLKIDFDRRLFWRDNEEIHLSPREFDLLAYMM
jgi:two-component system, OmpR family, KDP operon response regulator KdpE